MEGEEIKTWSEIPIKEYLKYISEEWRSRKDIMNKFGLSPIQAWHCVKYLSRLPEVMVKYRQGYTGRAIYYKLRESYIEAIENELV